MLGPPPSALCGRATLQVPPRRFGGAARRGGAAPGVEPGGGGEARPPTSSSPTAVPPPCEPAPSAAPALAARRTSSASRPRAARSSRGAAGMRLPIHPSLGGEQQQDGRDVHPDRVVIDAIRMARRGRPAAAHRLSSDGWEDAYRLPRAVQLSAAKREEVRRAANAGAADGAGSQGGGSGGRRRVGGGASLPAAWLNTGAAPLPTLPGHEATRGALKGGAPAPGGKNRYWGSAV